MVTQKRQWTLSSKDESIVVFMLYVQKFRYIRFKMKLGDAQK